MFHRAFWSSVEEMRCRKLPSLTWRGENEKKKESANWWSSKHNGHTQWAFPTLRNYKVVSVPVPKWDAANDNQRLEHTLLLARAKYTTNLVVPEWEQRMVDLTEWYAGLGHWDACGRQGSCHCIVLYWVWLCPGFVLWYVTFWGLILRMNECIFIYVVVMLRIL